jgi:hypothetical protein
MNPLDGRLSGPQSLYGFGWNNKKKKSGPAKNQTHISHFTDDTA